MSASKQNIGATFVPNKSSSGINIGAWQSSNMWGHIFSGVAAANMAKINGVAKANIAKVNGV